MCVSNSLTLALNEETWLNAIVFTAFSIRLLLPFSLHYFIFNRAFLSGLRSRFLFVCSVGRSVGCSPLKTSEVWHPLQNNIFLVYHTFESAANLWLSGKINKVIIMDFQWRRKRKLWLRIVCHFIALSWNALPLLATSLFYRNIWCFSFVIIVVASRRRCAIMFFSLCANVFFDDEMESLERHISIEFKTYAQIKQWANIRTLAMQQRM